MRGLVVFILFLIANAKVQVLTSENFDSFLGENELVLVEFYAPWCGHCKRLEPEYERASKILEESEGVLAKVDATAEPELGQRFGVSGYPTLKLFRSGSPSDYEGGRTTGDIVSFMKKQSGPAFKKLTTKEELESFIPDNEGEDPVVVLFAEEDSPVTAFMNEFANKFRNDYAFGHVSSEEVAGDNNMGSIALFKPFDERKDVFLGILSEEKVAEFLLGNSMPAVAEVGPQNYQRYVKRGLPMAWLFVDPDDAKVTSKVLKEYRDIAPIFKKKVSLVHLSGVQYKQMANKLGLSGEKFPALSIEKEATHYVFPETEEMTVKTMRPWFEKFVAGELEPTMKSEPVPAELYDENHVATVVYENFNEVVMDDTKDVLIEFYAPWCGHCKSLVPTWNLLGKAFKDVPSVVIAKSDATANDFPGDIKIGGFPTIKLVTSKGNKVVDFTGERELKAFLKFLKVNAATPYELAEEPKPEPSDNDEL